MIKAHKWIRIAFMVIGCIFMLATSVSSATAADYSDPVLKCTTGACQFKPATKVVTAGGSTTKTVVTSKRTLTSTTTIHAKETIIKNFEKKFKVRVAVYQKAPGTYKPKGKCFDPIKRKLIKAGQSFRNTRANGSPFWQGWQPGWQICGAKRVKIGKLYYYKGTKLNCGNKDILIPIGKAKKVKRKIRKTIETPTYEAALEYVETRTEEENSSGNAETVEIPNPDVVTYVCEDGWQLVDGNVCKYCPQTCVYECPTGSKIGSDNKCHKDGTTTPPPPGPGHPNPAPGPNPAPSPDDPTKTPDNPSGSWMCYAEDTNDPVQPITDANGVKRCPPGSYGG